MKRNKMNNIFSGIIFCIDTLPYEIARHIFAFLPSNYLLVCRQLSKYILNLTNDIYIWNNLCHNTFGIPNTKQWTEQNFKQYYLQSKKLETYDLLIWAIKNNCIGLLEKFITKNDASQIQIHENAFPLIYIAAGCGLTNIVELLILNKYNLPDDIKIGWPTPLYIASQNGYYGTVNILIKHNADINYKYKNFTPLYIASRNGHVDIVKKFISIGANVNIYGDDGSTPYYVACQNGYHKIVKLLIKSGADTNVIYNNNNNNQTPLYIACYNNHYKTVKIIIKYNKNNINKITNFGSFPLYEASKNGNLNIIMILINNGANILQQNNDNSSLYIATFNGHYDVVKYLLTKYDTKYDFTSLLEIARVNNHLEIVKLLMQYETNKNEVNDKIKKIEI